MGLHHQARRALRLGEPGFWEQVAGVDAVVIGGGDLLHPGTTVVRTGGSIARVENWGFVEAGLLGEVRPLAWNGLGVPFDVPSELAPALRAACAPVALLTVRDDGSRRRLEAAGVDADIQVVPDTAFLIDGVVTAAEREVALDSLRRQGEIPAVRPPARGARLVRITERARRGRRRAPRQRGCAPGPPGRAARHRVHPRR